MPDPNAYARSQGCICRDPRHPERHCPWRPKRCERCKVDMCIGNCTSIVYLHDPKEA